MALVKCVECVATISDTATFCPQCGFSETLEAHPIVDFARQVLLGRTNTARTQQDLPRKSKVVASLLAFPPLGVLGAHNFYLGEKILGWRQLLLTCTVFGIYATIPWAIIDFVRIVGGWKQDALGRELLRRTNTARTQQDLPQNSKGVAPGDIPATGAGDLHVGDVLLGRTKAARTQQDLPENSKGVAPGDTTATGVGDLHVGDVLSTSWTIYKDQMGIILGGVMIAMIIIGVANIPSTVLAWVPRFTPLDLWCGLLAFYVEALMMSGVTLLLLNVVKGRPAEIRDIFRGGRYCKRYFYCLILSILMSIVGLAVFIIPGIILSLMFWLFPCILVDRDAPGLKALWQSMDLTNGHLLKLAILGLAQLGLLLLGMTALVVGLFFTIPLICLTTTVAYMRLSGQKTIAD